MEDIHGYPDLYLLMKIKLDSSTTELLKQELTAGRYSEPSVLIAHALNLVKAERTDSETMVGWLLRNKSAFIAAIDEDFAAKELREMYSPEEADAMMQEFRAARTRFAA